MRSGSMVLGAVVAGFLALAGAAFGQGPTPTPAPLLIRGAIIIDGLADQPLRDRSILVEGNTIRDLIPPTPPCRPARRCSISAANSSFRDCSIPMSTGKRGWASFTSIMA